MYLESKVLIRRTPEQVGRFLGDISNIAKWDRGVSEARPTSPNAPGVGFEFETLGHADSPNQNPDSKRMAYRIVAAGPEGCTVQLTNTTGNARFFKTAQWHSRLDPAPGGTLLTCAAEFTLRLPYFFLAPILYLKRNAIQMDLQTLKSILEET